MNKFLNQDDLFEDEFINNLNNFEKTHKSTCPEIDEELFKYLIFHYSRELNFDKDISFDEYKFRTGIVSVLTFLQDRIKIQRKE